MDYKDQRKLAVKLLTGKIPPNELSCLKNEKTCFTEIMAKLKPYRKTVLGIIAETGNIPSEWAYWWVLNIGDREIMIDRITDSQWAYQWAITIGDEEIMIGRITDSQWAYNWGKYIGNREIMIDRVTESEWAYYWAKNIGDKEKMLSRVSIEDKRDFLNMERMWKSGLQRST